MTCRHCGDETPNGHHICEPRSMMAPCPLCGADRPGDVAHVCARDPVRRPSHYTSHPSGVECIQITEHLNFCLGNAVKYIWRAGLKEGSDEIHDLRKAEWYIQREIERRQRGSG